MISTENNLDWIAAKYAQAVIQNTEHKKPADVENSVTKALGVLQENGVYACFLYLLAKEKPTKDDKDKQQKSAGEVLVEQMLNLLDSLKFDWGKPSSHTSPEILSYITDKVTVNLERLLLAKETLEQMLIYARYGAKARQEEEKDEEENV